MRLPPNVTCEMLDAAFWLDRAPDPDAPLLAPDQIAAFNARVHTVLGIPPVLSLPETLPRATVEAQMRAYLPLQTHYTIQGEPVEPGAFERSLAGVTEDWPDPVPVDFGLVTQRTAVRAFPTDVPITSHPFEFDLDRAQETTVDVGWPVAVLASHLGHPWRFCLTPLYWGWVRAEHVAVGTREGVEQYATFEPFMMTTASRGGLINLATGQPAASQMGTRLPLAGETPTVYETRLPVPDATDLPLHVPGYACKDDFERGYLPLTLRTVFTQTFKMLGEPYAWGGARFGCFGRDCSRLIQDVYATAGLRLPRNGNQQGQVGHLAVTFTPDMDGAARQAALVEAVAPGAILEMPGHVLLYLGHVEGEPFAIHATSSAGFTEVIVSDLSLGSESPSGSLLHRLTRAVEVKQANSV
jgi:hypothetical protein